MRALVVVVLVACCAVGTEQASSNWFVYQDRLKYTSSELHEICDSPWSALGGVSEWFDTGVINNIYDQKNWTLLTLTFLMEMRVMAATSDASFLIYAGFPDGSFSGYYTIGAKPEISNTSLVYTEILGAECGWNYSAACNATDAYCIEGYPGANPPCREYWDTYARTGKRKRLAATSVYDPRLRPWYRQAVAKVAADGGREAWSALYLFSDSTPGITATTVFSSGGADISREEKSEFGVGALDIRLSTIEEVLRSQYPADMHDGLAYVTEVGTNLLIVANTGELGWDASENRVLAREANNSLIRATARLTEAAGFSSGYVAIDGVDYWLMVDAIGDARGLNWTLTALHEIHCGVGDGLSDADEETGVVNCDACDANFGLTRGRTRVIDIHFNVNVLEATPERNNASTRRGRPGRRSLVEK